MWLYAPTGARIVACVGGMDPRREAYLLHEGAHIVVGTPGRLRDHVDRGNVSFAEVAAVVLDEADEMLDLGFREDIEELLEKTPATRRTLLFSATLPREIQALAKRFQKDAHRIATVGEREPHVDIDYQAMLISPREREKVQRELKTMPQQELARLIQTLEEEMHEAAAELKFEYAARLRDEVNELRRELRDAG